MRSNETALLKAIFFSGVKAVKGYDAVKSSVRIHTKGVEISDKYYSFGYFINIIVLGAGKAGARLKTGPTGTNVVDIQLMLLS